MALAEGAEPPPPNDEAGHCGALWFFQRSYGNMATLRFHGFTNPSAAENAAAGIATTIIPGVQHPPAFMGAMLQENHSPGRDDRLGPPIPEQAPMTEISPGRPRLSPASIMVQRFPDDGTAAAAPATAPPAPAGPPAAPSPGMIVDDSVEELLPGQMKRSAFLAQLRAAVNTTVDQVLAGSVWEAAARPQINRAVDEEFASYSGLDSQSLEQSIRRQVPAAAAVSSAAEYLPPICERVRQTIFENLPTSELGASLAGAGQQVLGGIAEGARSAISALGSIFFKGRQGRSPGARDVWAVRSRLTGGHRLDSRLQAGMGTALGQDFSHVRVHTDAEAAGLAEHFEAHAFTVGRDIVFGPGEYQPGTPIGDALIAHELAHVAQQRGGTASPPALQASESEQNALEEEADVTAAAAVASLWGWLGGKASGVARNIMPRLRSGLALQRCLRKEPPLEKPSINPTDEEMGKRNVAKIEELNQGKNRGPKSGVWYWFEYKAKAEAQEPGYSWDPDYRRGHADPEYFAHRGKFFWQLKGGTSASAAIKSWFRGLTIADCASAAVATLYDTVRAAVGDEQFDAYFGSPYHRMIISQSADDTPLKELLVKTSATELKEGDWYYWANHPDYSKKHPDGSWSGENAFYKGEKDGKRQWFGFGVDPIDDEGMLRELFDRYNDDLSEGDRQEMQKWERKNAGRRWKDEHPYKDKLGSPQEIKNAGGGLRAHGDRLKASEVKKIREGG